jgi:hypothetical protein
MSQANDLIKQLDESNPLIAIQASLKLINGQLQKANLSKRDRDQMTELANKMSVKLKQIVKNQKFQFIQARVKL